MSSDHETADWDTHVPRGGWITDRYTTTDDEGNEDDERNQEIEADDAVPVRE